MTLRSLGLGLVWAICGCTANTSSSGEPETADSVTEQPTSVASVSAQPMTSTQQGATEDAAGAPSATAPDGLGPSDGTATSGDAGVAGIVSCDPRKLTCKRAEPACEYGYVPRIINGCYAECVRIDDCVCDAPDACPQHERYTCNNSRQRCTPYLN